MTITFLQPDGVPITAQAERQGSAALYGGGSGRPLGGRSGFRVGTATDTLTATSTTWTLKPCAAQIDPGATTHQGMYGWASDANITGAVTASDATYARKDIVYIQINDSTAGDGSGATTAPVVYLAGTPSATPAAPALPARSFLLGTIDVPKTGGGSPAVTLNPSRFVAAGGVLPVSSKAERDALTAHKGLTVRRTDVAGCPTETYDGAAWTAEPKFSIGQADRQPILQAGNLTATTNANGDFTLIFPTPFPTEVKSCVAMSTEGTNPLVILQALPVAPSNTQYSFRAFNGDPGLGLSKRINSTISITWIAVGS